MEEEKAAGNKKEHSHIHMSEIRHRIMGVFKRRKSRTKSLDNNHHNNPRETSTRYGHVATSMTTLSSSATATHRRKMRISVPTWLNALLLVELDDGGVYKGPQSSSYE